MGNPQGRGRFLSQKTTQNSLIFLVLFFIHARFGGKFYVDFILVLIIVLVKVFVFILMHIYLIFFYFPVKKLHFLPNQISLLCLATKYFTWAVNVPLYFQIQKIIINSLSHMSH